MGDMRLVLASTVAVGAASVAVDEGGTGDAAAGSSWSVRVGTAGGVEIPWQAASSNAETINTMFLMRFTVPG